MTSSVLLLLEKFWHCDEDDEGEIQSCRLRFAGYVGDMGLVAAFLCVSVNYLVSYLPNLSDSLLFLLDRINNLYFLANSQ